MEPYLLRRARQRWRCSWCAEFDHFPGALRLVPAALAVVVALFIAGVGRWRQRPLHRPLPPVVTARWEISAVGISILGLIAVTAVTLPL